LVFAASRRFFFPATIFECLPVIAKVRDMQCFGCNWLNLLGKHATAEKFINFILFNRHHGFHCKDLAMKASDNLISDYLSKPPDVKYLPRIESLTSLPLFEIHSLITSSALAEAAYFQHKRLLLSSYSWDLYDYLFALPPFDQENQRVQCRELLPNLFQCVSMKELEIMLYEKLSIPTYQANYMTLILFSIIFTFEGYKKETSAGVIDMSLKGFAFPLFFVILNMGWFLLFP
jgi:hypothetical protein